MIDEPVISKLALGPGQRHPFQARHTFSNVFNIMFVYQMLPKRSDTERDLEHNEVSEIF